MRTVSYTRHRGSIIVFVLMGLIAVLAVGVALLSRAGREDNNHVPTAETSASAPAATDLTLSDQPTTATAAVTTASSAMDVIVPPPPPTPVPEIDSRGLPPEG
jgi:cytoskeletal protein RodZ